MADGVWCDLGVLVVFGVIWVFWWCLVSFGCFGGPVRALARAEPVDQGIVVTLSQTGSRRRLPRRLPCNRTSTSCSISLNPCER